MRLTLSVLFLLVSCGHQALKPWNPQKNAATQSVHQQVLAELDQQERTPAALVADVGANLADLSRVRPGKFSIYVFPKITSLHHKTSEPVETYLGPPRAFEVSVVAENPCQQFLQRGLFARLRPQDAFPASLGESRGRRCAIIEVTDLQLKQKSRGLLRPGDTLMQRLFVDDAYTVYAIDAVLYDTPRSDRTVRLVNDENLSSQSGLSLFPIDLPSRRARVSAGDPLRAFGALFDDVAVHQIRARHQRSFVTPECQGAVSSERDALGSLVKVGWCRGLPWPSYSENARFFSVTQPLTLGGRP